MRFSGTAVDGVIHIEADELTDERGSFARLCCPNEMGAANIDFTPRQTSLSRNVGALTLRGMHYATEPESKLVRCTRGRVFDVAVDLRPSSPTFRRWASVELDAVRANAMFIPAGIAHGFLTLVADCDVLYQIDRIYRPGFDAGVRWNDPAFCIAWPAAPAVIHPRDASYPDFAC